MPVVAAVPPPPIVLTPSPDEAVLAAGLVRQAAEELEAVHARRDQLLDSIAAAERRLAGLREEARELEKATGVREVLDAATTQVRDAERDAAVVRREADQAAETFREVNPLLESARTSLETVRATVAEADAAARRTTEQLGTAQAEADRSLQQLIAAREEFGGLDTAVRRTLDELRAAVEAARTLASPPAPLFPVAEPAAERFDLLPDVVVIPPGELADDTRERLTHYLNDAGAAAREQAGLLQALADATEDAELRGVLESHLVVNHRQQAAMEERVRALGGEPATGRQLFGRVVTRIWDALQPSERTGRDTLEVLLQALGAAEFMSGAYLSVNAFARAVADGETAGALATQFHEERAFADRLRQRIPATAATTARRASVGACG